MSSSVLALLALVGFGSGFVDAIAGGGGLLARLGARAAMRAGARLVRPLIVIVSCAMALRLMAAPSGILASAWKLAFGG